MLRPVTFLAAAFKPVESARAMRWRPIVRNEVSKRVLDPQFDDFLMSSSTSLPLYSISNTSEASRGLLRIARNGLHFVKVEGRSQAKSSGEGPDFPEACSIAMHFPTETWTSWVSAFD